MAREKGTGSLQLEKSGRWTMRVGIKGNLYCSTPRTTDTAQTDKLLAWSPSPRGR